MATTTDCMTNPLEGHPAKSEEQRVASTERVVNQPQPGSMRELLTIAIPMVISAGSQSLMHIIDRIYLTWHHVDEVAAALPAGIIFWAVLSIFHGMGSYVNTFVAQYEGAVRPDRVAATMWQGFYFALISGGLLMLLAPFSGMFFAMVGHDVEIQRHESTYLSILLLGGVPTVLATILGTFFTGRGKTTVVMFVNVVSVAFNAVLDYVFIFGWGPIPEMGIAGGALTDVIANVTTCVALGGLLFWPSIASRYQFWKHHGFDRELTLRMLYYGFPVGLLLLIDVSGWAFFMNAIGWLGKAEQVATNLAFNLNTLAFIPVIGLGIAVSTLVGMRITEGRPDLAARTTWLAVGLSVGYILFCSGIYLFLPQLLLAPYEWKAHGEDFAEVKVVVIQLLWFVAAYSFFDTLAIVFGSAIRGAGDTRFSMIFTLICVLALLIAPTVILFGWFKPTLSMCWAYCSVYIMVMGLGFMFRFLGGKWKSMRVVEPDLVGGGSHASLHTPPVTVLEVEPVSSV